MERAENLMVIEALVLLDGPVDRARFERVLRHRVVDRYPVFRQRLVRPRLPGGLPRWADVATFDVADHVRQVVLPAPGDDIALQEYVEGFLSAPLPRDRPLWEVHLVDGLTSGSAMYVRLHHAMSDGIALTRVLLSLTDADPDAQPDAGPVEESVLVSPAATRPRSRPARLRSGIGLGLKLGVQAVQAVQAVEVAAKLVFARNPTTTMSARSGRTGRDKLIVWSDPIPLAHVKEIARANRTTINDVVVGALAGALQRSQSHRGERPVDVRTMIPVNLRPLDEPLPARLGNRFAVVLLTLPSGLATPLARLAETKRRMDEIKGSPEAVLTSALIHGIGLTGAWLSRPIVSFFTNKADAVTTNVPGPREHRYLAGTRIDGLLGWVPASSNQTLGTCIFTYAGTLRVGFKSDALAIPDPGRLLAGFVAELAALHPGGAAAGPGVAAEPAPPLIRV